MTSSTNLHHVYMNANLRCEAFSVRMHASEMKRSGIERPCEAGRNACLAAAGERLQTRQKKEGGQII